MKLVKFAALSGALLSCVPALAHTASAPVATTATVAPAMAALPSGTPVNLKMAETITTKGKALKSGYRFHLTVLDDVKVGNQVVIPAGSPAMGEVVDVRNKGMWGKSGRINAQLLYATANGRQIKLRGRFDDKGVTGTAGVVASIALVPIAGFFTTGTSATIAEGLAITGATDEEVAVSAAAMQ